MMYPLMDIVRYPCFGGVSEPYSPRYVLLTSEGVRSAKRPRREAPAADVSRQSTSSSSLNDVWSDGPVALLVEINVDESDAGAMRFYERHGFTDCISREVGQGVDEWVGGHFEFVELAVMPDARGCGIGRRLHDALLADLPHERALLSTSARSDDPAVRLYSSNGWVTLATYGEDRQVMGRVLT